MSSLVDALVSFYIPLALGCAYAKLSSAAARGAKTVAQLLVYIFLPSLIFVSLYGRTIHAQGAVIPVLAFTAVIVGAALARLVYRAPEYVLPCMYPNAGYLPIPLAYSLWGDEGVAYVALYIVGNNPTANTLAPLVAGGGLRNGLKRMVRFPPVYAVVAALVTTALGIEVPRPLLGALAKLGAVAPPLALVLLGMEFASAKLNAKDALRVGVLRLVIVAPAILAAALALNVQGIAMKVLALELVMPPAVSNVALASELGLDSKKVANIVVTLTLVATLIFVPCLLVVLGA